MTHAHHLSSRFKEALLHGEWIGNTNYQKSLASVNWQQATQRFGSLNTIAILIYHINYYLAGTIKVFEGGPWEVEDQYSFDCPPIQSQEAWETLRDEMLANADIYGKHVAKLSEEQLDSIFVDESHGSYRRNIEGMIEHSYYHLGQITFLKKMMADSPS